MTKRIGAFMLVMLSLLSSALVGIGYSFFFYSDGNTENATAEPTLSGSNALFDSAESNEYYRVYFFASPYYATGAEIGAGGATVTDPLEIANSSNNPYNLSDPYMLIGGKLNDAANRKFANAVFSDGNYHYISYKSQIGALGEIGALESFEKRDYTGYIRANEALGITKTSTYISLTVQGNISAAQLSGIVAATEFKDKYGFGPEFIGWTYDKATTSDRTMYGDQRYTTVNEMKIGDSRGWGNGTGYELGNFGCQGEIVQVTSMTSLKAIDQTSDDGSLPKDRVIYLYPVFISKNYSSDKSIDGKATAVLKFRVNPDTEIGVSNLPKYEYKQSSEIDYSQNRYTVGLFQRKLNETKNNINYYIDNLYIGGDKMQLDICPANGTNEWGASWTTVLTNEKLSELIPESEYGYYNVDVTFVQLEGAFSGDTAYVADINALLALYEESDKYVKLYSSLDVEETTGVVGLTLDRSDPSKGRRNAYFVIGFQKVEEFHLVGDNLNDSLTGYLAPGYKTLYTTRQLGDSIQYIIERVYLHKGGSITVLSNEEDGKTDLSYSITPMNGAVLDGISADYGIVFTSVGSSTSGEAIVIDGDVLKVNDTDSYTLIFTVDYVDGLPSEISVAFRKNDQKYSFIVLNSKPEAPTQQFFISSTDLSDKLLVRCEATVNSYLELGTVLTDVHALSTAQSSISTIADLFSNHEGMSLIDCATGTVISRDLFADGSFCLNRNYILYFE